MTALIEALLKGRKPARAPAEQKWTEPPFWSMDHLRHPLLWPTSLDGNERIEHDFEGYVKQAYKENGVVFACVLARQLLFSETRFQFRRFSGGRPGDLFGDPVLALLERPWPGGTTGELLARMESDSSMAGNFMATTADDRGRTGRQSRGGPGRRIVRMRPDWVTIVSGSPSGSDSPHALDAKIVGYQYLPPGSRDDEVLLLPEEVCHYSPIPDPAARWRGMSWLTPVLREIEADKAATSHKGRFFRNGATPALSVSVDKDVGVDDFFRFKEAFELSHKGADNAYKTLFLGGGADVKPLTMDMRQLDFKITQGAGETRVAAAARVPPVIVGLSEGLAAQTYCGTYDEAVWSTRGIVKLGEIASGDVVWSFVDNRIVPRKVVWHAETGTKPVYTIRTRNRTIRFTDNHPVLVRVPGNVSGPNSERSASTEWRRVDQLNVGDSVVQARHLPDLGLKSLPNRAPATAAAMQWLGAYTGDGCLTGADGVAMCIPIRDRVRGHYAALAVELFTKRTTWRSPGRRAGDGLTPEMVRLRAEGLTYREIVRRMGLSLHPMSVRDRVRTETRDFVAATAPVVLKEARNSFRFSSRTAAQWHHGMGVTGTATTKRVPGWIFELSEDLRLAYLAGIVDTDGSVGRDGRLAIQFASRDLVHDVRMLLISCGIACSNVADVEYRADVLPNRGLRQTYQAWRFVVSSAVEVARIPFADPLYRERVDAHRNRHRPAGQDAQKAGLHEDLGFYTVRSIEVGPPEPVYDIEVEDGHSFLVDGIVVHNSNYNQAKRHFADGTIRPLWRMAAASLQNLVDREDGSELWYDDRDISFLREDQRDAAEIQGREADTVRTLIEGGFTADSAVRAVTTGDFTVLEHTGYVSVQLQQPGATAGPVRDGSGGVNGQQATVQR